MGFGLPERGGWRSGPRPAAGRVPPRAASHEWPLGELDGAGALVETSRGRNAEASTRCRPDRRRRPPERASRIPPSADVGSGTAASGWRRDSPAERGPGFK